MKNKSFKNILKYKEINSAYTIGLAIRRLKCFYETFAQGSTLGILFNFCAKIAKPLPLGVIHMHSHLIKNLCFVLILLMVGIFYSCGAKTETLAFKGCLVTYAKYSGGETELYTGHYMTNEMQLESAQRKLAACLYEDYLKTHDTPVETKSSNYIMRKRITFHYQTALLPITLIQLSSIERNCLMQPF